jgi:hypothetical protein
MASRSFQKIKPLRASDTNAKEKRWRSAGNEYPAFVILAVVIVAIASASSPPFVHHGIDSE